MYIDVFGPNHLTEAEKLCYRFHQESGTKINYNKEKVLQTLNMAMRNHKEYIILILRHDNGVACGILGAQIVVPHFSNDRVAMEWLWYVDPSYRSSKSIQLLKAYLYWAFDVMKCDHATMSTLDSELADKLHKLYTKIGFSKQENTYIIGRG